MAEQHYQAAELAGQKEKGHFIRGLIAYGLGKAAFSRGDNQAACRHFRRSLEEAVKQGNQHDIQFCLEALAALNAALPEKAAITVRLGGAVKKLRRNLIEWDMTIYFLASFDLETVLAPIRSTLGEIEFDRLYTEGLALTLEQVVALALEE